ncbi:MAG: helix-turn-helix transcriptional regulator, partial [Pseudomonadota bacterium]
MSTADNPDLVGQEPDLEAARKIAEDLGQKLKSAREAQKIGVRELARQLNLTSNTVEHIED